MSSVYSKSSKKNVSNARFCRKPSIKYGDRRGRFFFPISPLGHAAGEPAGHGGGGRVLLRRQHGFDARVGVVSDRSAALARPSVVARCPLPGLQSDPGAGAWRSPLPYRAEPALRPIRIPFNICSPSHASMGVAKTTRRWSFLSRKSS